MMSNFPGSSSISSSIPLLPLKKSDFPVWLRYAVGGVQALKNMQEIRLETQAEQFESCLHLDMVSQGPVKGVDQFGRVFVLIGLRSIKLKNGKLFMFAIFDKLNLGERDCFKTFYFASSNDIPTEDERILPYSGPMNKEKYAMIKEIMEGKHPDLIVHKT